MTLSGHPMTRRRTVHQLSIRGFDKALSRKVREVARREGISLNKAALLLMRRGAGLTGDQAGAALVGDALDSFIGCWSEEEEREFLRAVDVFETVDPELWR